jgi:Matrixin
MSATTTQNRRAFNRRVFIGGLGSIITTASTAYSAQSWRISPSSEAWKKIPSIVVMSNADDARLSAVYEAVAFWNAMFANVGSLFRLGRVTHTAETIPPVEIRRLWTVSSFAALDRVGNINGDIFVVLSDLAEASFTAKSPWVWKALVVIGSDLDALAPRPNGLQNMIAHEFGHAIGLDHNSEPATLMCGGSSRCHSKRVNDGFLPLTRRERVRILEMYPPDWAAE